MRVPLHWLREHCPTDMEVGELADRLSQQGVHVEGVIRPWEGLSGVIVAEVLEKRPHPRQTEEPLRTAARGGAGPRTRPAPAGPRARSRLSGAQKGGWAKPDTAQTTQ